MLPNIDITTLENLARNINELEDKIGSIYITTNSMFSDDIWILDTKPVQRGVDFSNYAERINNKNLIVFWKLFIYLSNIIKNTKNTGQLVTVGTSARLIKFLDEINFLNGVQNNIVITNEQIGSFIQTIQKEDLSPEYSIKQFKSIEAWFQISPYLPSFLKLPFNPIANINLTEIFKKEEKNKEESEWSQLSIDDAMLLSHHAIKWVELYGNDILSIYEIWKDYAGKYVKYKSYEAFGVKYTVNGVGAVYGLKLADIVYKQIPNIPDTDHPFYDIWNLASNYTHGKISISKLNKTLKQKSIMNALRAISGASIILILFSTGMRKSELHSLKRNCIDLDTNPEIPLIESEVFKTNTGTTKLPISLIGVKSVEILKRIGLIITKKNDGPLLIPLEKSKKDTDMNKVPAYSTHASFLIQKFCEAISFDNTPNLHSFRHTLAVCVWERIDQAPVLLQLLFNHASLSMTLEYLRSHPLIKQAKKELFSKKYLPLVREIIHNEKNGKLSGSASSKITKLTQYIINDPDFKGKTEPEIETTIEEFFMTLLEQEQIHFFLTPLCVCVRTNTSTLDSPCMHVDNYGDSIYAKQPRTDRCIGSGCQYSFFMPYNKKPIHESLNYYKKSLNYLPDDLKSNVLFAQIADNEINKYSKLDKKISKGENDNA